MDGAATVAKLAKKHGARAMGRKLGISHVAVLKIAKGAAPKEPMRRKLLEIYGVPMGAWASEPAGVAMAAPVPKRKQAKLDPLPDAPVDALGQVREILVGLREDRRRLESDPTATGRDRASVASALASATRLLAKVDGSGEITVSQILRSPHWRRLMAKVAGALRAFPGAGDAVAATLEALE